MALSLHRAQLFAASAQLAFGPLNRDSGAGARAGWVLEDPDGYCTKERCRDWKNPGSETIPAGTMQKKFLPSVDASGATTIRGDTRAYLVLDHAETAPPRRSGSKGRRGKESRPLRSSGRRDRDVEM